MATKTIFGDNLTVSVNDDHIVEVTVDGTLRAASDLQWASDKLLAGEGGHLGSTNLACVGAAVHHFINEKRLLNADGKPIKQVEFKHLNWFVRGAVYEYQEVCAQPGKVDPVQFENYAKDTLDKMYKCLRGRPGQLDGSYSDFQCTLWFQVRAVFGDPEKYEIRIL